MGGSWSGAVRAFPNSSCITFSLIPNKGIGHKPLLYKKAKAEVSCRVLFLLALPGFAWAIPIGLC